MATQPRKKKCITCMPQDITELILLRLSVSTLLRCRGVCKQWDATVRDPQFIAAHLRHASRQPLLFFNRTKVADGRLYPSEAVLLDESWTPSKWEVPVIDPDDFLCASCNGLVCLYSTKSTIKIANIATGECMHLAKPVKNSKGDCFSFYNFGFHPATKEYKVTHFLRDDQQLCNNGGGTFSTIQVYTLGDEKWRDVATPKPLNLSCVEHCGVVSVDGAMYWLTKDSEISRPREVVSFDLNDEHLELIQLPEAALANGASDSRPRYQMTEIDGKVSVATVHFTTALGISEKLQIWVLDSKLEKRWCHKYIVEVPALDVLKPHFVFGDKIVSYGLNQRIYSSELMGQMRFSIELNKLTNLLDFSPRWDIRNMQSHMFVRSLVRLDPYKKAGVVRRPKRLQGWKLKKWESWEDEHRQLEKIWRTCHEMLPKLNECAERFRVNINLVSPHAPDQVRDRSLRRPNWLELQRDIKMLASYVRNMSDAMKVLNEAVKACTDGEKMIPAADQDSSTWSSTPAADSSGP